MPTIWSDLRFASRTLRAKPVLSIVAVASLALGIGANTAIFSVIESALLRGLPFHDAERLVHLRDHQPGYDAASLSPGEYLDYRNRARTLSGLAAAAGQNLTLTGRFDPQNLRGLSVTPNYFQVLGAQAYLGRLMSPQIDKPSSDSRVAVLSYGTWQSVFGSDPNIIGRDVTLNGNSFRIVGVLRPKQEYPSDTEIWISPRLVVPEYVELQPGPMAGMLAQNIVKEYGDHWLWAIGRMRPGMTLAQTRAELNTIAANIARNHPNAKDHRPALFALQDTIVRDIRPALWVLLTAVVLLLLIACANLAGLLLARATGRVRELAVRVSLGASRWEISRLLLAESLLLAFLGGAAGVALAKGCLAVIAKYSPYALPAALSPELNSSVLAFCLIVTLIAALLSGLMPALRSAQIDVNDGLKEASKGSAGRGATRLRQILVAGEIALSVTLLIAATLLLHSFSKLIATDPGFNSTNVITARLSLPARQYPNNQGVTRFWQTLLQRTAALSDVESASVMTYLPMSGSDAGSYIEIEGHPVSPDHPGMYVNELAISPETFRTMLIPLITGRVFNERDNAQSLKVAVINKQFAEKAFPRQNPIGKRFRGGPVEGWFTVIGVVGDIRHDSLREDPSPDMFFNYPQFISGSMGILVRARGTATYTASGLRKIVHELDSQLPLSNVKPLGDYLGNSLAASRFLLGLLTTFSALAILLAGIGLYAVLSHSVQQRSREIGIRMALGAQGADVLGMVVRECFAIAAVGLMVGLFAAVWSSSLLKSMLFGVTDTDLMAYGSAILLLLLIVSAAAFVPAWRALRTDPVSALRYE